MTAPTPEQEPLKALGVVVRRQLANIVKRPHTANECSDAVLTAAGIYAAGEVTAALEIARRVPLTTVFGHRYTAIPDSGVVELSCGTHNSPAKWEVGYHPSLDVLIGQAAAHDRTEHGNDSGAGDHAAEIRKLRSAVRELLDSTGLDDGEKAEWLERASIDLDPNADEAEL